MDVPFKGRHGLICPPGLFEVHHPVVSSCGFTEMFPEEEKGRRYCCMSMF